MVVWLFSKANYVLCHLQRLEVCGSGLVQCEGAPNDDESRQKQDGGQRQAPDGSDLVPDHPTGKGPGLEAQVRLWRGESNVHASNQRSTFPATSISGDHRAIGAAEHREWADHAQRHWNAPWCHAHWVGLRHPWVPPFRERLHRSDHRSLSLGGLLVHIKRGCQFSLWWHWPRNRGGRPQEVWDGILCGQKQPRSLASQPNSLQGGKLRARQDYQLGWHNRRQSHLVDWLCCTNMQCQRLPEDFVALQDY